MARPSKKGGKTSAAKARKPRSVKGRNPKKQAQKTQTVDPQQLITKLQRELDQARGELAARNTAYTERIAYQAAANDVLKVMSASPGDPQPVFDLLSVRARDLCDAYGVTVYEFDGSLLHWRAATGVSDDPAVREAAKAAYPSPPSRHLLPNRAILDRAVVHVRDHDADAELRRISLTVKSSVVVPFMRGNLPIGALHMGSRERGGFSDSQVELLKTFADQAVIAIGSAETYRALQTLTTDLQQSLKYQTATSDVLKVISRAVFDLQMVLDTLVESAYKLCGANLGLLYLKGDEAFECKAIAGPGVEQASVYFKGRPIRAGRATSAERVIMTGEVQSITDFFADPDFDPTAKQIILNAASSGSGLGVLRSTLAVPMTRDNAVVGVLVIASAQTGPFPSRQIELLQTFADQAVIAIENARLFEEVQTKTRDLEESLQQQTATAEVLKVISSSPGELEPVFHSILENAVNICDAKFGNLFLADGETAHWEAGVGTPPKLAAFFTESTWFRPTPDSHLHRVLRTKQVSYTADDTAEEVIGVSARLGGARSTVCVPMLKDDTLVGAIVIYRTEVRPFTDKQIDLVKNFAAQGVIAIENARLLKELRQRTDDLSVSLDNLRAAQDRLVQTEKLASLGQLTAGIAHEIKNPLNFVNNFSALSAELVDEMTDVFENPELDEAIRRKELDEIRDLLKSNLEKVVQHGKRADAIVKNMLLHSREGSGELRAADVNGLVEESLNLAYHGARAEKHGFNIVLERDLDPDAGAVELYPQEITRALLNLISNGFYAATQRKFLEGESFEPVLIATTKNRGKTVEIRIRDNGTGITDDVKEKIFNPFFTTKPSGEGTGLGLSMSHDIIVKQHGGTIEVETEPGLFTEFKIVLPRTNQR